MNINLMDELGQDWLFLDGDLKPETIESLRSLGVNKSETRIWREYVYSGFLNRPDSSNALKKFLSVVDSVEDKIDKEKNIRDNALVGHALMVYNTVVALENKLSKKIAKSKEVNKQRETEKQESLV